jgi:hypothetical protein
MTLHEITAAIDAALDDADWARAAAISGCKPPSAATRAVVAELVEQRRRAS